MATIVLTVAGGLIGGPLGAAIGGTLGGVIDREVLFKPKGREGPRLSELRIQTSSYGTQIPKLFGTMRVAGSVIWATELDEHRSTSGGKGRPSTTSYAYTASFAVALSARLILSVGRIWADGKLLRGAAGDWKTRTGFRLHLGAEDQAADPLIAAVEGAGMAPAHRGIAYAVFEDLELGDFGNRIPSLTFEVTADAVQPMAGAMLEEIAGGSIVAPEDTTPLGGFSAHGASVRAVAETLAGAAGGWFRGEAGQLSLLRGAGVAVALDDPAMRSPGRQQEAGRRRRAIAAADHAPRTLTLTHYDPARDYQSGMQRAGRSGAGVREARMELAAAIGAGAAKTIAEDALARLDIERERRTLALGWDRIGVRPGERVTIADAPGLWRVERSSLEAMVLTLECVRVSHGAMPAVASGGRALPAPDDAIGTTIVRAFELPPLGDAIESVPRLAIAAAGTEAGWRRAALLTSGDGESWVPAGSSAQPAVIGTLAIAPKPCPAWIEDRVSRIEVQLVHDAMELADADQAALDGGANLAMLGGELIQFGRAEALGDSRWRLSGLWRGRRGTEAAIGGQAPGAVFVLIDADTLAVRELSAAAIGTMVHVLAQGVGDAGEAAEGAADIVGIAIVPPAPVHLRATVLPDGITRLDWVRRSRIGWRWIDGADAPLGEERERYRVTLAWEDGAARIEEIAEPWLFVSAADRGGPLSISVRQIGTHGLSPPATRTLPAIGED
ncbi:MAG: hypothetical protein EOP59_02210 [Sphingomonadales bacterium]|nr:MAG: hypothetical protein EOP59_02210 [Sphingomonadales bacterium]